MRRFGLLGRTLKHSFSKGYFTEKFRREERTDCAYENFELDDIRALPHLLERLPGLEGFNITIPYKREILPFLHRQDEAVTAIGACNCIRIRNGRLEGFNTDWKAFRDSLSQLLTDDVKGALILGTGGASAAIRYALEQLRIRPQFVSRTTSRTLRYEDIDASVLDTHRLVVNTTPLGTWPDIDECPPIPYELLGENHLLYDLVYNPERSQFLSNGAERGARIKNGYEMLVLQAEASWEIWNRERVL